MTVGAGVRVTHFKDDQRRLRAIGRACLTSLALVACLCVVASCGAEVSTPTPVTETITVDVQPETAPFMQELADSFARGRAGLTILLNQTDSSDPLARLRQGNAMLATSATALQGEHSGWLQTEIARQPIAVIVHPDNPVKNLTLDDLGNIYTGRVTEWKSVGGQTMPIMVLAREAAATVRRRMDTILIGADSRLTPNAIILPSDMAMIATVSRRPEAIGYVAASADSSVKMVSIAGEQPSALTRSRYYPLWRSVVLISPAEPSANVTAFLAYVRGRQGQRIIASWGYGQGGSLP